MIDFNPLARPHETYPHIIISRRKSASTLGSGGLSHRALRRLLVTLALTWVLISVLAAAWLVRG